MREPCFFLISCLVGIKTRRLQAWEVSKDRSTPPPLGQMGAMGPLEYTVAEDATEGTVMEDLDDMGGLPLTSRGMNLPRRGCLPQRLRLVPNGVWEDLGRRAAASCRPCATKRGTSRLLLLLLSDAICGEHGEATSREATRGSGPERMLLPARQGHLKASAEHSGLRGTSMT